MVAVRCVVLACVALACVWTVDGRRRSQILEQHYSAVKLHADSGRGRDVSVTSPADVSTDDLVRTLSLASGLDEERYKQPSAMFLLELYRRLQHGGDMARAAGTSDDDDDTAAIRHSNTVRSFTATGTN